MVPVNNHFELDLNIKTVKEKVGAEFRITVLLGYVNQGLFDHLDIANLHLLGILYYHTEKFDKSYETFCEILKRDPNNINAYSNIAFVCKRLLNSKGAKKHEDKRKEIENYADTRIQTRFKAEHAFAHAFDMYSAVDELRRYHESNDLLDECLKETISLTDFNVERAEWMMCKIWNLKKLFNRNYLKEHARHKNEEMYQDIMKTLVDIQESVPEKTHLKSLSWAYFGYFFWKKPVAPSHKPEGDDTSGIQVPAVLKDKEMADYFHDPKTCFEKAIDIKESVEVLILYGSWLQSSKLFDQAVCKFTNAIDLDDSDSNYFSFSKRGECLLQKVQLQAEIDFLENSQNMKDLERAATDLELAARVNQSAYSYRNLAQCFFLLSKLGKLEMTAQALAAFQKGLVCLDGLKDSRLHLEHAECLKHLGEDQHALVSMQRAVENQNPNSSYTNDIKLLLQWYTTMWCSAMTDHNILLEASYWFQVAFTRYSPKSFKKIVLQLMNEDSDFIFQLFAVCWNKANSDLKKFCVTILREKKGTDNNDLVTFLTISSREDLQRLPALKSPSSMQPRNKKGYEYDFYVIHNSKDSDWVRYSLLNHLENLLNFKGLVEDRDFQLGKSVLTNIADAIKLSFKIILVITPNFLESHWNEHETEQALTDAIDKGAKSRIIPIRKDNADVPESLNHLHNMYLEEDTDLEKLVLALDY